MRDWFWLILAFLAGMMMGSWLTILVTRYFRRLHDTARDQSWDKKSKRMNPDDRPKYIV